MHQPVRTSWVGGGMENTAYRCNAKGLWNAADAKFWRH